MYIVEFCIWKDWWSNHSWLTVLERPHLFLIPSVIIVDVGNERALFKTVLLCCGVSNRETEIKGCQEMCCSSPTVVLWSPLSNHTHTKKKGGQGASSKINPSGCLIHPCKHVCRGSSSCPGCKWPGKMGLSLLQFQGCGRGVEGTFWMQPEGTQLWIFIFSTICLLFCLFVFVLRKIYFWKSW